MNKQTSLQRKDIKSIRANLMTKTVLLETVCKKNEQGLLSSQLFNLRKLAIATNRQTAYFYESQRFIEIFKVLNLKWLLSDVCLSQTSKAKNKVLRDEIISLEGSKKSLAYRLEEYASSRSYKTHKELTEKLNTTIKQQMMAQLTSENIFNTMEMYEQKIFNFPLPHKLDNTVFTDQKENTEEIIEEIKVLETQIYQNNIKIQELWNMNTKEMAT